jgi:hypothetical protein
LQIWHEKPGNKSLGIMKTRMEIGLKDNLIDAVGVMQIT